MAEKKIDIVTVEDSKTGHTIEFQYDKSQKILFTTYLDEAGRAYRKDLQNVENPNILAEIRELIEASSKQSYDDSSQQDQVDGSDG